MKSRILVSILLGVTALWGAASAYRSGVAGTIVRFSPNPTSLRTARAHTPRDPQVLWAYGNALSLDPAAPDYTTALDALKTAVALSPTDYRIHLSLGRAFSLAGDDPAAEAAFRRAGELAPAYFLPKWALGNQLVRNGRVSEALPLIRDSLRLDKRYVQNALELIWQATDGDAAQTTALLSTSDTDQIELMNFFLRRAKFDLALAAWRNLPSEARALASRTIRPSIGKLLESRQFDSAWEIWSDLPENRSDQPVREKILNGSFDSQLELNGPGFGWTFESTDQAKLAVTPEAPRPILQSLRLTYNGPGSPSFTHLRQIVLIQPNSTYRLGFSGQSENLQTGAGPRIAVFDITQDPKPLLDEELSFAGTQPWKPFEFTIQTGPTSQAIELVIRRAPTCAMSGPCPIYGRIWLTGFSLQKTN